MNNFFRQITEQRTTPQIPPVENQQNPLGADFYFVDHGDEAARRAVELGVKPQIEEAGKNEAGEFVYRIKITAADAEKLQQVKTEYAEKKAQFEEKTAQAQSEVNQMFADQGRVLWNSTVNTAEGIVNTLINTALTNGGTKPILLLDPNRPQADFSSAKSDYRSEMMRRDINGKLDGDGIKAGQYIEKQVTDIAPFVVGAAITKAAPQSLKTLGGIPEVEPLVPPKITKVKVGGTDLPATSKESVDNKLWTYLLDPKHPQGGPKAKWFKEALGFTKENMGELSKQIAFDASKAVKTQETAFGVKYNQTIPIKGANGRTIDILFGWIKNEDNVIRLTTAIPAKK